MEGLCETALPRLDTLLAELEGGNSKEPGVRRYIKEVNRMADSISGNQPFLDLMSDWIRDLSLKKNQLSFRLKRETDEGKRLLMEAEYSRLFFERIGRVCRSLRGVGHPVLKKLPGGE